MGLRSLLFGFFREYVRPTAPNLTQAVGRTPSRALNHIVGRADGSQIARQKLPRSRLLRIREEHFRCAFFDDDALIHEGHLGGDMKDGSQPWFEKIALEVLEHVLAMWPLQGKHTDWDWSHSLRKLVERLGTQMVDTIQRDD